MKYKYRWALLALILFLAACGGKGPNNCPNCCPTCPVTYTGHGNVTVDCPNGGTQTATATATSNISQADADAKADAAARAAALAKCPAVTNPAPTVNLTADSESIAYDTGTTLRWTTSNSPTSCVASGDWSGNKSVTGGNESTGTLTSTRTYTLTCTNSAGSGSDSATVSVGAQPQPTLATLSWRLCSGDPKSLSNCSPIGADRQSSYSVARNGDFAMFSLVSHAGRSGCYISGRIFGNIGDGSSDVLQSQPEAGAPSPIWVGYGFDSRVAAGAYTVTLDFTEECSGYPPNYLREVVTINVQ